MKSFISPLLMLVTACVAPPPVVAVTTPETTPEPTTMMPPDPTEPGVCGDGVVDAPEECDEGKLNDDNGACTNQCTIAACGDGLLYVGVEGCDDGNLEGSDGCSPDCLEPRALSFLDADARLFGGGEAAGFAGATLAGGADFNGDGFDDVVVGAYLSRAVYVVHGPVVGNRALAEADATLTSAQDWFGGYFAILDDASGTGLPDLAVGLIGNQFFGANTDVPVFAGPMTGDLSESDAVAEFAFGDEDNTVKEVATAGDTDGDGRDELLISTGEPTLGEPAVFVMESSVGTVASGLANAVFVNDEASFSGSRYTPAPAGDLNRDGMDDIWIGASRDDMNGPASGGVYGFFGPLNGELTPNNADVVLLGPAPDARVGTRIAAADINGDGQMDVVVSGASTNRMYLVYGPLGGVIDLSDADVIIEPASADENFLSVVNAGDINADGRDDILISGNNTALFNGEGAGVASLVLGPVRPGRLNVADADVRMTGSGSDDLNLQITKGGDVDGDGLGDIWVAAPSQTFTSTYAQGLIYFLSGQTLVR
ncbi:MAG: FG-GAP-like repeat-containing protein [Myxococcota bacterium]